MPTKQRFTLRHPCPICGGADDAPRGEGERCFGFLSADGLWAHCTREDHAGGLPVNEKSETYAHRLMGDCLCGERHDPSPPSPNGHHANGHYPGTAPRKRIVATYDYRDESGKVLYQVVRYDPKAFLQRRPDGRGDWIWNLQGVRLVLYRLPEMLVDPEATVWVCEGEKDADNLAALGFVATTNAMGAAKWGKDYTEALRGRSVVVLQDADEAGQKHVTKVAAALNGVARSLIVLPPFAIEGVKGADVSDWLATGGTREGLEQLAAETAPWAPTTQETEDSQQTTERARLDRDEFLAYLPEHKYIYAPTGKIWIKAGIDRALPPIQIGTDADGNPVSTPASKWLDANAPVHDMTWHPGKPRVIADRFLDQGGWIEKVGARVYNGYRPPLPSTGDPAKARRWIDLIQTIYPTDAEHILDWLAHRVQHPAAKINHALVLGGMPGIGKDTMLEPVKAAIGNWNFNTVSPVELIGRFNAFLQAVILLVSELRDLGDRDRYGFYEHSKTLIATPPDTFLIDEKNVKAYRTVNVAGVIFTTNHRTDGLFLPADDRRHYVAWSEAKADDFPEGYWLGLYRWFESDGIGGSGAGHVAAYLTARDLSWFDPKAPPPKTAAFWDIVAAGRSPEDADLADALDAITHDPDERPDAVTVQMVVDAANRNRSLRDAADGVDTDFARWLKDRRNSRQIPHRFESEGYVATRNPGRNDGLWVVGGKRQVVYAKRGLSIRDRIAAAQRMLGVTEGDVVRV